MSCRTCVEVVRNRKKELCFLGGVNKAVGGVRWRKIAFPARLLPLGFLDKVVDVGIGHVFMTALHPTQTRVTCHVRI